jgi:hypothetical protein
MSTVRTQIMLSVIDQSLGLDEEETQAISLPKPKNPKPRESGFSYVYHLGLSSVAIGLTEASYKGVFISKPMPASGNIGEVRLKTKEENYHLSFTNRHSDVLTSVEYSVSSRPNPNKESDWVPILPVGNGRVVGERLFLDVFSRADFRFLVNSAEPISIYRNGYRITQPSESYIQGDITAAYQGVLIGEGRYRADDIFTCDYIPAGNATVVNFERAGFADVPLVTAYDNTGAGEKFSSSGERNTITLSNSPYINEVKYLSPGYSPLTIQFNDGTVARNYTDYRLDVTSAMPDDDNYYYIHSGNTVRFNKPIFKSFKVYYQYLQNNVRVRVVLRCNSLDFVSPKVDFYHLKAKIRQSDMRRM